MEDVYMKFFGFIFFFYVESRKMRNNTLITAVVVVLVCLVILVWVSFSGICPTHSVHSKCNSSWMKSQPPLATLVDLVIPGSHDSLTYNWCSKSFKNLKEILISRWAQTQSLTLYDQLVAGVRYLDVRVGWNHGKWMGQHGSKINMNVTYESALQQLNRFIREHPTEIVIIKFTNYDPVNQELQRLHETYLKAHVSTLNDSIVFVTPLEEFWKSGHNVVFIPSESDSIVDPYEHDRRIDSPELGYEIMSNKYSTKTPRANQLVVLQWIAVYSALNVLKTVYDISRRLNSALTDSHRLLPSPPVSRRKHNVVMIDFVDCMSAQNIIYMNNI